MKKWIALLLLLMRAIQPIHGQNNEGGDSQSVVANLSKHQLIAVDAALREMRKLGQSIRKFQLRIEEHSETIVVAFVDDPVDMATVGGGDGLTWEIRKSDGKVLRRIFTR